MFALPDAGHCSNPGDGVHVTVKQGACCGLAQAVED